MKYVVYAIVLALSVPLYSQEIRLDSLWIKMGGYPVMAFSPDSKVLVLGSEILEPVKGAIRCFEVETGRQLDSITKISFIDFGFSPSDGNLYIVTTTSIDVYDKQRMLVRRMPYTKGGLLSFSPDGKYLALYGESSISIVKSDNAEVVHQITRPTEFQTKSYFNGRVNFNSDGTLLYGKNAEDFGSWDLTKANTPFVRKMTIGNRAVIGFTPDNRYMVQQSNYIWDLTTKTQVQIEGLESYTNQLGSSFALTQSGTHIVVTQKGTRFPLFINPYQKKIVNADINYYAVAMAISPDSSYFAYQYGNGRIHVHRISWQTTQISDDKEYLRPHIYVTPLPSRDSITIVLVLPKEMNQVLLEIHNIVGEKIGEVYRGSLSEGTHEYHYRSGNLSNGTYYIIAETPSQRYSVPFIINQ
ncbi:MAG: WD40 repeat domain-containing protein [Ignavibacteria bacterium]|nr:WD40 repeat domain-containing protein [Ignavibacteria bacterium]